MNEISSVPVFDKEGNIVDHKPIYHRNITKICDADHLRIVSAGHLQIPTQIYYRLDNQNWIKFKSLGHINEIILEVSLVEDIDFKYQDKIIYGRELGLYPVKDNLGIWLIYVNWRKDDEQERN